MAIKTQGTYLYAIDPADDSIIDVACIISIDGIDTSNEQIETTCLQSAARTYLAGLATPGQATFGINTDTSEATHVRLHALKVAGTTLKWAVGWSDGTTAATADTAGNFELDSGRSWITFDGFMTSYPFSFAQNAVVQSTIGIQISGEPTLTAKV